MVTFQSLLVFCYLLDCLHAFNLLLNCLPSQVVKAWSSWISLLHKTLQQLNNILKIQMLYLLISYELSLNRGYLCTNRLQSN